MLTGRILKPGTSFQVKERHLGSHVTWATGGQHLEKEIYLLEGNVCGRHTYYRERLIFYAKRRVTEPTSRVKAGKLLSELKTLAEPEILTTGDSTNTYAFEYSAIRTTQLVSSCMDTKH
jgi:hypothetical protein